MSTGLEGTTKGGHLRRVPMADQAAAALDRLSQRQHFVSPDDDVFCSAMGRPLHGSALRRRYKRARDVAKLHKLGERARRAHGLGDIPHARRARGNQTLISPSHNVLAMLPTTG